MTFPTIPTVAAGRVIHTNQANTTATRTFPAFSGLTYNDGDLLLAIVVGYQSSAVSGYFSSWSNGFTEISDQGTSITQCVGVAYKIASGTESGSLTVTQAATVTGHASMILMAIPNAHATIAPEVGSIATGTTSAANPSSFDPSGWGTADTLWISVVGSGMTSGTGSWTGTGTTAPTNYGNRVDSNTTDSSTTGQTEVAVAFRQRNAASEDVGTAGVDTSNARNVALVIAVPPAQYLAPFPYTDTFDRANSTDQGIFWVEAAGAVEISSNALKATSAPAVAVNTEHILNSNVVVSATIGTNDAIAVYARIAGPTSVFALSSGGTVTITDHDDGGSPVDLTVATGSATFTGGDVFTLVVFGTTAIALKNGTIICSNIGGTALRTTASGATGLYLNSTTGTISSYTVEYVAFDIDAQPGSFALTGADATLAKGYSLDAQPGSFTLTGADATLARTYLFDAQPESFVLTGAEATLIKEYSVDAQPGSFTLTGVDTALLATKVVDAQPTSFTLTGAEATLSKDSLLDAQPGAFSLVGFDATLEKTAGDPYVDAQPGSFSLIGADATLFKGYPLNAEAGSFAVTGATATAVKTFAAGNGDLGIFDPKYCDDPTTPGTVHRLLSYVDIDELGNPIPPNSRGTWWAVSQGISTSTDYGATWGSPTTINKAVSYNGDYLVQNEVGGLVYDAGESDSDQKWKMVFMRTVFDSGVGGYLDVTSSSIMMRTAPAATGPWSEPVTLMAGTSYDSGNTYNPGTSLFTDSGAIVTGEPGILAHPTSGFYMVYTGGTGTPANDYIKLVRIYKVGSTWTLSSIGNPLNNTTDITYFQALGTSFPSTFPDWDLTARFDGGDLVSASDGRKWLLITPTKSDYSYRGVACIPFDDIDTATLLRDSGGDPVIEMFVAAGAVHHGAATASIYATDPGLTFSYIGGTPFEVVETGTELPRRIDAQPGSFALTGNAATLTVARLLSADPGSFALTGVAASLLKSSFLDLGTRAFTVSGIDASLLKGFSLDAQPGTFSVTGASVSLIADHVLDAQPGSYAVTGADATLTKVGATDLDAQPGAFALSGSDATLAKTHLFNAEPGSFALSGVDATLARGLYVDATAGAVAVSGADATLLATRVANAETGAFVFSGIDAQLTKVGATDMDAAPGAFSLTGAAATLARTHIFNAEPGTYTLSGAAATLAKGYSFNAELGSYVISGITATLAEGHSFNAELGAFTFSGVAASLVKGYAVLADPGSFSVTGGDATLTQTYIFDAELGAFTLSGADAQLTKVGAIDLDAQPGTFSVSGSDTTLTKAHVFNAEPGAFTLSGADAALTKGKQFNAEAGTFAVSGAAATLLKGHVIGAETGAFAVSGAAATTAHGYVVEASLGTFVVTGAPASTLIGRAVDAQVGAFSVSGLSATLAKGNSLAASSGAFVFTGAEALIFKALPLDEGLLHEITITGVSEGGSAEVFLFGSFEGPAVEYTVTTAAASANDSQFQQEFEGPLVALTITGN